MFRALICPKHVKSLRSKIKITSDIQLVLYSSTINVLPTGEKVSCLDDRIRIFLLER